ncbi:amphi-Trp domain-containing protein [Nocardia alba]|uniref:Amphi-Trp domain-containing protein n=1 Tax=Nocardia alba TaxID=225051 RepID=A0A4R1FHQ9_9NOCA|nr:amphi-Trp domain-containing protein [Nocardia alba]TCJ93550.1 amphi-Trp domain-containing protein [Nocardia alba]
MPKLEIKRKTELSRKEAGERLIMIGRALVAGSEVELKTGDDSIEVVVADRLRWELEIEVDGDETEIEIEISWHDDPVAETSSVATPKPKSAPKPAPAKTARRPRARKTTAK